jgi:D-3-phosphoglycerate dehydrogenase
MGITTGSLTIPELSLPQHPDSHRILHIHDNVPGVLSEINTRLSDHHINILSQYLKTNDSIGYVVLDVDKKLSAQATRLLKDVKNTIKTRLLY